MVTQRITIKELEELVGGDKEKASEIWEVSKSVVSYTHFKSIIDLGLNVGLNDIPFERAMIFSWIKEVIENGRKT